MLNELAKQIHEIAVAHGWWENECPFPEIVALCHSELSEALEEYRHGRPMSNVFPHRSFTVCGSQAVNVWNRRDDNATD